MVLLLPCVDIAEIGVQSVEAVFPVPAVVADPVGNIPQRVRAKPSRSPLRAPLPERGDENPVARTRRAHGVIMVAALQPTNDGGAGPVTAWQRRPPLALIACSLLVLGVKLTTGTPSTGQPPTGQPSTLPSFD